MATFIYSDFRAPQNKVCHCFPIYLLWSDGTGCHDVSFWMLSFKLTFSLPSLTFIIHLIIPSKYIICISLVIIWVIFDDLIRCPIQAISSLRVFIPHCIIARACVLSCFAQSCLTLFDPMDCSSQAILAIGFSRQEYWCGLPFPPPGDLSDPGIEPMSPVWQAVSLPLSHLGKPV